MDDVQVTPFFVRMLRGLPAAIAPLIVFIVVVSLIAKFGMGQYQGWRESGGSMTDLITGAVGDGSGIMIESVPAGGSPLEKRQSDCRRDDICFLRYDDLVVSGSCDLELPECEK